MRHVHAKGRQGSWFAISAAIPLAIAGYRVAAVQASKFVGLWLGCLAVRQVHF